MRSPSRMVSCMTLDQVIHELQEQRRSLADDLARVDRALKALGAPESNRRSERELGPKALLLSFFQRHPEADFTVDDALEAIKTEGWTTSSANPKNLVASTLGALARADDIDRVGPGVFRLRLDGEGGPDSRVNVPSDDFYDDSNTYIPGADDD